jgi:tRNA(fMet)-specific endonuclease VapC
MAQYLLDTDMCIYLLKDKFQIKEKIEAVGIANCFISEITIAELTFGAYNSEQFEKHIKEVAKMELLFDVIPIYDCLTKFGEEKVRLKRIGQLIPDFDLLIGVTSVHHGMTMVSNNEKHLSRIEGIKIENWRKANS